MSLHIHCVHILYQCPACICVSWATLQLGCNKKINFAASNEVISFRINDQSYSLIGFNQYVIKKWLIIIVMSHQWPCIAHCCILVRCANCFYFC